MSEEYSDERKKFIPSKGPVKLSPSWEEQKLTNEDLNFKGTIVKNMNSSSIIPKDTYLLVFFIFMLHGLGTLLPWNMFITAKGYFTDFKLGSSDKSSQFLRYLTFASQVPNVLFNWLNVFVNLGGDLTKRIVYSILIEIIIFIITVILAMVNSDGWSEAFFWITMICVVLLNVANGVYQNTIYGMVAVLPVKYTGAVVLGSNISGLFATLTSIASRYVFTSQRTAAIYYFITALIILLVCFDTYFALPLNRFFRYYNSSNKNEGPKEDKETTKVSFWEVFKAASPQLFNVFFTFFITLSIFPAFHSDIRKSDPDFFISDSFFVDITCYLTFNLFAMLGSLLTSWVRWPSPKFLVIPVALRAIFLPLFLFCNYIPNDGHRNLPVLIKNDWIYWLISVAMSFSSGYLSSLGMMYSSQTVEPHYQLTAGMFASAMLITGIFTGVLFSFAYCKLILL